MIDEQHVIEDFRRIPTLTERLKCMPREDWMFKTVAAQPKLFKEGKAVPGLLRAQGPENARREAESLAVLNGLLHSAVFRDVRARLPTGWNLDTTIDQHRIGVRIFTKDG